MSRAQDPARIARYTLSKPLVASAGVVILLLLVVIWTEPHGWFRNLVLGHSMVIAVLLFAYLRPFRAWLNQQAHNTEPRVFETLAQGATVGCATIGMVSARQLLIPMLLIACGASFGWLLGRLNIKVSTRVTSELVLVTLLWVAEWALPLPGDPVDVVARTLGWVVSVLVVATDIGLVLYRAQRLEIDESIPDRARAEVVAKQKQREWNNVLAARRERRRHNIAKRRAVLAAYR